MKTFLTAVISFVIAGVTWSIAQADTIHWALILKDLGVTATIVVSLMAGVWKALRWFIERHDSLTRERMTQRTLGELHAKTFIPKIVTALAENLGASKAITYRLANGDDHISAAKNFKITILHEELFPDNAPAPKMLARVRDDYQDFLVDEGYYAYINNVRNTGVSLVEHDDLKSRKLLNMWKSQGIESSIAIWVGALPSGFIYVSLQYQTKKVELNASEMRMIDVALNQLRDLYHMDLNQFKIKL